MIINDILQARPVLVQLNTQKMPAKLAYALAKNIKLLDGELETFEQARTKMLSDNWELEEGGANYKIPPEDQDKLQQLFNELLEQEVKPDLYTVNLDQLEGLMLSPAEVQAISWMIKE